VAEPETEVAPCPACNHLLRVPLELLGARVQCPECKAFFLAPTREANGTLIAARPLPTPTAPRKSADPMLLAPAFGLLLCGVAALVVNGVFTYRLATDPVAVKDAIRYQLAQLRELGVAQDVPPAEQDRADDEQAERVLPVFRWALPIATAVSAAVFLGGLSMLIRWNRRLAQAACVLAAVNVPHLCCVPGAVVGLWGLLMLASAEGRDHFAK
jgi:hypothetical protein